MGPGAGVALAEGGLPALEQGVAALEAILAPFSIQPHPGGGYDITITRANLYVVNGAGSTATANGLGNVVIGYNESRGEGFDVRTGSHMLVVDSENNYSSWGGIVVGFDNETDGQYSSVSGGRINTAGGFSSVSGGGRNQADGVASSVSGGVRNEASTPEGWAAGTILSTNVRQGSPRSRGTESSREPLMMPGGRALASGERDDRVQPSHLGRTRGAVCWHTTQGGDT